MKHTLIAGLFVASLMISCTHAKEAAGKSAEEAVITQDAIFSYKWILTNIHEDGSTRAVTGGKAFIRFNKQQESAGGNGSCNSFGSTLKTAGNTLSISQIMSTKMYCDDVQSIENSFLGQLPKVTRYEIKDKTLQLFAKEKLVLEFSGEPLTE
jgi:heat shock protein HslJ